jgi:hypothetical protein
MDSQTPKVQVSRLDRSKMQWVVPKSLMIGKTTDDIMMENGYHPAGYGSAFNKTEDDNNYYFNCWASCD